MKTIADYQPSPAVKAVLAYAAAWVRDDDAEIVEARFAALGALKAAVFGELPSQEIWCDIYTSDAWCTDQIRDAVKRRKAATAGASAPVAEVADVEQHATPKQVRAAVDAARAEERAQRYSYDATEQRAKNAEHLMFCALALREQITGHPDDLSVAALKDAAGLSKPDFIEALGAHLDAGHLLAVPAGGYSVEWRGLPIARVRLNV